jgi:hypothetical protein
MDTLRSFIKTHLHTKTIIFLSTCKEVCMRRVELISGALNGLARMQCHVVFLKKL